MKSLAHIRPANPEEADSLSSLALRSKAHWGYPPEFMKACRKELVIPKENLISESFRYMVAELNGQVVGYYGIERLSASVWALEAVFVEPSHIGSGIGRLLVEHAKKTAVEAGAKEMLIQADPNAEPFYRAAGGVHFGQLASASIPGRYLPLFTIQLAQGETNLSSILKSIACLCRLYASIRAMANSFWCQLVARVDPLSPRTVGFVVADQEAALVVRGVIRAATTRAGPSTCSTRP